MEKKKSRNWKRVAIFFALLSFVLSLLAWYQSKLYLRVSLPPYDFNDFSSSERVMASGSWTSTTELAMPLQTINFDCRKDGMTCVITTTYLDEGNGNFLNSSTEYIEIESWKEENIRTSRVDTGFGCVEYQYELDRLAQTVTSTRRTIDQEGMCEGIQDDPIVMKLDWGYKRIDQWRLR